MSYASKVIGYAFQGDNYCPNCILVALYQAYNDEPQSQHEMNKVTDVVNDTTEVNLDHMAIAIDIDRYNEATFNSFDFPKVLFSTNDNPEETCIECGEELQ